MMYAARVQHHGERIYIRRCETREEVALARRDARAEIARTGALRGRRLHDDDWQDGDAHLAALERPRSPHWPTAAVWARVIEQAFNDAWATSRTADRESALVWFDGSATILGVTFRFACELACDLDSDPDRLHDRIRGRLPFHDPATPIEEPEQTAVIPLDPEDDPASLWARIAYGIESGLAEVTEATTAGRGSLGVVALLTVAA